MAKNIASAIDVGGASIKVMVAEMTSDSPIPRVLGVGEAETLGVRKGAVVDIEEATKSIIAAVRDAERSAGVSIKHAYVAIGGAGLGYARNKGIVAVSKADNEITGHDVERAVELSQSQIMTQANKEIIHSEPMYFTIDQDIVTRSPIGMSGMRLEVETFFATALQQHIRNLIKSVEDAGITVDDVIVGPLAAAAAVAGKKQKEAGVAVLDVGAHTVSLAVFEEGIPLSLEVFPIGSGHITNDIAIGFQLPMEEAEKLKCGLDAEKGAKSKLTDIIGARLSDIFELVDKHLKKIGRNRLLPAGVILTGGGANLPVLEDFVKKELQLPVSIGIPQIRSNYAKLQDPRWSVAAGVCVLGLASDRDQRLGSGFIKSTNSFLSRWFRAFLP